MKCAIGFKYVNCANNLNLIKFALLTDTNFRSYDFEIRKKYIALQKSIERNGGHVEIVSSGHAIGEKIDSQYLGAIAVLHTPIDLYYLMGTDDEEEEEKKEEVKCEDDELNIKKQSQSVPVRTTRKSKKRQIIEEEDEEMKEGYQMTIKKKKKKTKDKKKIKKEKLK